MTAATRTAQEESSFMKELLADLDGSMFDASPSPDAKRRPRSPVRSRKPTSKNAPFTPTKSKRAKVNSARVLSPFAAKCTARNENSALASLLDGAEDWDWGDMDSDFLTPKKSPKKKQGVPIVLEESDFERPTCTRCIVREVSMSTIDGRSVKSLLVDVDSTNESRRVILRDGWINSEVKTDDVVNVIGNFELPPSSSAEKPLHTISISAKENFLVHYPDILVTATSIANAHQCRRKPLLQSLVRSSTEITPALVWGNVLHEVMQSCLQNGRWDDRSLHSKIENVVRGNLGDLMKLNVTVEQAVREVKAKAGGLKSFADKYISQRPKEQAVLVSTRSTGGQTSLLSIKAPLDIEEDIWSPTFGLKGKLDASLDTVVEVIDRAQDPFKKAVCPTTRSMSAHKFPFEIKTGRAITGMEHRAQTMLYTLLMSERYDCEVQSGLLYYTQSEEVVRVPAARNEIAALVMLRNEMAQYMMRRMAGLRGGDPFAERATNDVANVEDCVSALGSFLPPTIDDVRSCGKCYVVDTCMLYRRAVEGVVDESSPIKDIYELKTSHLSDDQAAFFKKWEALVSMEEQELVRFKKELWTMRATEREAKGRCFADMVMDSTYSPPSSPSKKRDSKIHQYTYRFVRSDERAAKESLLNGHISLYDAVTVSIEPDLLALARGFVLELSPDQVVIGVDHDLSLKNIRTRRPKLGNDGPLVYRIDKDELFGGMSRIRENLVQLFHPEGDPRRLQLLVDLKKPKFDAFEGPLVSDSEPVAKLVRLLNTNQQEAMRRVLSARDYALILGMPGTGKTTVVATLIRILVSMGKTVLLTSYTHSAVDTILLKLRKGRNFPILRLGNLDKIHPDIHEFTLDARRKATTVEQLEQQVMAPPVVATTCLSIDHPLFLRRKFDYCIVDEASQITLPTCLGPLRYADKFVLVGDHFQLPPLVRNPRARKGGLDVSLFRRLSEAHPHAVVDLTEQYRMNEDIMLLSNKLIYNDRLRCGNDEVAKRGLDLPDRTFLESLHADGKCGDAQCWIERLLDKECKAVFVDTDAVPASDSRVGDLVQNTTEAHLVHQVTEALLRSGVAGDKIGIISLYRQQIKVLSHLLQEHSGVEILTADRSQGRDKDCIIISMVRSNEAGMIGDLLKDWRRINVSFTRARSKLVIFGSRRTLKTTPLLKEFFSLMESQDWILTLPPKAHELHAALRSVGMQKRTMDTDETGDGQGDVPRSLKRARRSEVSEEGLLSGRFILKDLMNDSK